MTETPASLSGTGEGVGDGAATATNVGVDATALGETSTTLTGLCVDNPSPLSTVPTSVGSTSSEHDDTSTITATIAKIEYLLRTMKRDHCKTASFRRRPEPKGMLAEAAKPKQQTPETKTTNHYNSTPSPAGRERGRG